MKRWQHALATGCRILTGKAKGEILRCFTSANDFDSSRRRRIPRSWSASPVVCLAGVGHWQRTMQTAGTQAPAHCPQTAGSGKTYNAFWTSHQTGRQHRYCMCNRRDGLGSMKCIRFRMGQLECADSSVPLAGSKGEIGDPAKSRCKIAEGGLKKCRCLMQHRCPPNATGIVLKFRSMCNRSSCSMRHL